MSKNYPVKTSQFKMNADSENETWLVFDIETDGLYDAVTKTFCIVAHDIYRKQTVTYGPDCIDAALDYLAQADVLIGHNIIFYDLPVLKNFMSLNSMDKSLTHWSAPDLFGPRKNYLNSTQIFMRTRHHRILKVVQVSRRGVTVCRIIRLNSKILMSIQIACLRIVSKTLTLPLNF